MITRAMMDRYPADINLDRGLLAHCVDACFACAQACTACADACLSEKHVQDMTKCIRTDLDCADICDATGRVLSRHTGYDANLSRAIVQACIQACKTCADECEKHGNRHEHCKLCAEACRYCAQKCQDLEASMR